MGDYTAKAQQMLRGRSASPEVAPKPQSNLKDSDFPKAPKEDLKRQQEEESSEEESEDEPLISA